MSWLGGSTTYVKTRAGVLLLLLMACWWAGTGLFAQEPALPSGEVGTESSGASDGKVRMLIFKSEDCPECVEALGTVLPELERDYAGLIETQLLEITEGDNILKLFAFEKKFGDTGNEVPVVFVGGMVFGGPEEVVEKLPEIVPELLLDGGCDYPVLTDEELAQLGTVRAGTRYLAYFYQQGCRACDRVTYLLLYLSRRYPSLDVQKYDIGLRENKVINEAMSLARNVPQRSRLVAPSICVGAGYLVDEEIVTDSVEELLDAAGAERAPWDLTEEDLSEAEASLRGRFRSLKIITVAAAGLLDGINPCAFATMIFFISYLATIGRTGRELVSVGIGFSAAVFFTYLTIGLGLFQALQSLTNLMQKLSIVLYVLIALIAIVIGAFSVYDFVLIKRGNLRDMKLQLPAALKRRIQLTISKRSRTRKYVFGAIVAGGMVSLLEFACTGQVYLPTITWAVQDPALRQFAYPLLVIYNLMFVIPLVAIFLMAYYGLSSKELTAFLQRRAAAVKLATAVLFFAMAGLLLYNAIF